METETTPSNTFTDRKKRDWTVAVSFRAAERLRDELGLDVFTLLSDKKNELLATLSTDLSKVVGAIAICCESQMHSRSVSPEDFAEGLFGDELEAATRALLEGIVDFYGPGKAPALRTMIEKVFAVQVKTAEKAAQLLNGDELDAAIEETIQAKYQEAVTEMKSIPRNGTGTAVTS